MSTYNYEYQKLTEWNADKENCVARLIHLGEMYNHAIHWHEETESEEVKNHVKGLAAGIAEELNHLDLIENKLNEWEIKAGY